MADCVTGSISRSTRLTFAILKMKINYILLPVKAHYFLFMAASGAVLPYLQVMGKQLGISEVVMGSVTALLPPLYLLAKPLFGILADYFSAQRRFIFILVLAGQNVAYGLLYFIPNIHDTRTFSASNGSDEFISTTAASFDSVSSERSHAHSVTIPQFSASMQTGSWITDFKDTQNISDPQITTMETNLYSTPAFWIFVALLSIGTVLFNVANSVSDAITFDVLGEGQEMSYGVQRVWGTIGFGVAALLSGSAMELWSTKDSTDKNYAPALALAILFGIIDIGICYRHLQMPLMPRSNRILRDVGLLLRHRKVAVFLVFAAVCGILDGFIIYYLFWYLEDLAIATDRQSSVKLLEGLIVAAETLCGETVFFYLSGTFLKWMGNKDGDHSYARGLTFSLLSFAARFFLISFAANPWFMLPIEAFMQGPTYALSYTAIVGYAAVISPPGASSTMQGLVAGVDDGLGYSIGSLIGGVFYKYFGGKMAFQIFAGIALIAGVFHHLLYECYLRHRKSEVTYNVRYKSPRDAAEAATDNPEMGKILNLNEDVINERNKST